jgi:hypothetical protein
MPVLLLVNGVAIFGILRAWLKGGGCSRQSIEQTVIIPINPPAALFCHHKQKSRNYENDQ